ncbi:MAG: alanine--tRNA ligase [Sphingorhabdus sp.]
MTSTNDIRRAFLDHFAAADHDVVPSAPLVPYNDPTLMFVNAGMVPFKNVFTGLESRDNPRATSSQKCVRAGGKHNDLDNVGYTARHHTFFEMLGNFSFGDYFKAEAIGHAWSICTKTWGLDPARLTATVYHTDDEAFDLWKKITGLPDERIIRIATSDNFWSMGDTGPCGPCSEIFYDHGDHLAGGPPGSADEDGDRFVEIWNLVFMQYERQENGDQLDLPKPSIDTGMGLERIAAVLQGVHDNYDTDTFKALIHASEEMTSTKAEGSAKGSHRVIADHLRSTSFLIADGVLPSNEGRGYVLRRIMRRAMRHAHILGSKDPLMHRLVGSLTAEMGAAYPELVRAQALIEETLKQEETRFRQTLDKGLKLLDGATAGMASGDILPGETAFKLYDTYGFPYDLTEDALRAQGFGIDHAGFEAAMDNQKAMARAAWKGSGAKASDDIWFDIADRVGSTEFTGYTAMRGEGQVASIVKDGAEVASATAGDEIIVITNQTPFYGESGGQMGDTGSISSPEGLTIEISDTAKPLGRLHAHIGKVTAGKVEVEDTVHLAIDAARRDGVRANHSATHLVHAALRGHLGEHVTQKGSLVAPERLRFDFAHPKAVSPEEIAAVEAEVNAQIRGNQEVTTRLMTPDDAIEAGALALFGEKYGDEVRVLSMGDVNAKHYSVELCGGTHVNALGDIQLFTVISEGAIASGVRRIEALTGEAARRHLAGREAQLKDVAALLKTAPDEVAGRVETLLAERRVMEKQLSEAKTALAVAGGDGGQKAEAEDVNGIKFLAQVIVGVEPKALRGLADEQMKALENGVTVIIAANENANTVVVAVSSDLTEGLAAPNLVRAATEAMGGQGGGGRPEMAQGGGPAGEAQAQAAVEAVRKLLSN